MSAPGRWNIPSALRTARAAKTCSTISARAPFRVPVVVLDRFKPAIRQLLKAHCRVRMDCAPTQSRAGAGMSAVRREWRLQSLGSFLTPALQARCGEYRIRAFCLTCIQRFARACPGPRPTLPPGGRMGGVILRTTGFKRDDVTLRIAVAKPSQGRARPFSRPSNAPFVPHLISPQPAQRRSAITY